MTPLSISTSPVFITEAMRSNKCQTPSSARSSKFKYTSKLLKKKYEPPLRHKDGGTATSYTSLPMLQDFTSSPTSSLSPAQEVKLSDFATVPKKPMEEAPQYKLEEETNEDGEDDVDYGRYELFVAGSDAEGDDCSDFEEEDEEDWGEFSGEANYIVGEVFEPGNWENSDEEYEEEMVNYRVGEVLEPNQREKSTESVNEKEKGVPAVMRCFDKAKIYVKAGDGGNGVVAFRREKFVPLGGPSGGNGGRGGNVYVDVDASMNSLLPFRNKVHYRAGRGSHGQGSLMDGAKGEDVVIRVAPGTVIRDADKGEVLLELLHPGQRALLLPGGRGGRGNAVFKCSGNKAPKIAENGEEGVEMWLELELKLVADVGIVGAPNAGKSTLLSVISAAKPEIASYPFTTLLPNLGVVSLGFDSTMVVADLPGLLEGAHRGFGLGHEFLRHTERCSALVHVIDGSSPQPELEFDAVRLELELFNPEVAEKPYIVAFNKMDLPEARENWGYFSERMNTRGIVAFCISAAKGENTKHVVSAAYELLNNIEREKYVEDPSEINHVAEMVKKKRQSPINEFQVSFNNASNTWLVDGEGLRRFIQMTNWKYVDSERRFQHVLDACGVNKSLVKMGVKEGDNVTVCEMELVWHDSVPSNKKVGGSTKWPELK